jgi:hypothetical protein
MGAARGVAPTTGSTKWTNFAQETSSGSPVARKGFAHILWRTAASVAGRADQSAVTPPAASREMEERAQAQAAATSVLDADVG